MNTPELERLVMDKLRTSRIWPFDMAQCPRDQTILIHKGELYSASADHLVPIMNVMYCSTCDEAYGCEVRRKDGPSQT